jgi:hypothetical protein
MRSIWRRLGICRAALAVAAVVTIAALGAGRAAASTTSYYYGFNYLTVGAPTDCMDAWSPNLHHGCAQSGFNNWDWSQITKNSGDWIALGFRDTSGGFYYLSYDYVRNGTTFHITRTAVGAPPYNRAFCAYQHDSSSYVRCSAVIA